MNDRLYELINQTFIGTHHGKLSDLNTAANVERFANLLIQECAKVCYDPDKEIYERRIPILYKANKRIKDHFGVE